MTHVVGEVGGMGVEVLVDPRGLSGDEQTLQIESFKYTLIVPRPESDSSCLVVLSVNAVSKLVTSGVDSVGELVGAGVDYSTGLSVLSQDIGLELGPGVVDVGVGAVEVLDLIVVRRTRCKQ